MATCNRMVGNDHTVKSNDDVFGQCHANLPALDGCGEVASQHADHLIQVAPYSTTNRLPRYLALFSLHSRFRDVEDLPAERGLDVSHETVWRWFKKFGSPKAVNLRRFRPIPSDLWH